MRNTKVVITSLLWVVASLATAQSVPEYDRVRGELSPGTQAPTRATMAEAIRKAPPTSLFSTLEYGERVECFECIPLLHDRILSSDDSRVREIAAWWIRRRPFGFGAAMRSMRHVLETDADPVRRARAAEAMGEFMDSHATQSLDRAADPATESEPAVRAAAVRALGRLNVRAGHDAIVAAMGDNAVDVRLSALSVVTGLSGFQGHSAAVPLLNDSEPAVRRKAALVLGQSRVGDSAKTSAVPALAQLLQGDSDPNVRQAAAWTLGRIGGTDARDALNQASVAETNSLVRDAIEIALKM